MLILRIGNRGRWTGDRDAQDVEHVEAAANDLTRDELPGRRLAREAPAAAGRFRDGRLNSGARMGTFSVVRESDRPTRPTPSRAAASAGPAPAARLPAVGWVRSVGSRPTAGRAIGTAHTDRSGRSDGDGEPEGRSATRQRSCVLGLTAEASREVQTNPGPRLATPPRRTKVPSRHGGPSRLLSCRAPDRESNPTRGWNRRDRAECEIGSPTPPIRVPVPSDGLASSGTRQAMSDSRKSGRGADRRPRVRPPARAKRRMRCPESQSSRWNRKARPHRESIRIPPIGPSYQS